MDSQSTKPPLEGFYFPGGVSGVGGDTTAPENGPDTAKTDNLAAQYQIDHLYGVVIPFWNPIETRNHTGRSLAGGPPLRRNPPSPPERNPYKKKNNIGKNLKTDLTNVIRTSNLVIQAKNKGAGNGQDNKDTNEKRI